MKLGPPQGDHFGQAVFAQWVTTDVILLGHEQATQPIEKAFQIKRAQFTLKDAILDAPAIASQRLHDPGAPPVINDVIADDHPLTAVAEYGRFVFG
jgi:hypothetical protein